MLNKSGIQFYDFFDYLGKKDKKYIKMIGIDTILARS